MCQMGVVSHGLSNHLFTLKCRHAHPVLLVQQHRISRGSLIAKNFLRTFDGQTAPRDDCVVLTI
ncbi:hypothetical protein BP1026B_II0420 [Burkholderia pseudomallei 1026b]|uniref:Uncharacterized protein n=1 Tax=Burkholderia pseudomallei (strain 1026b) TaxID=884204 RepID=A0A0H3HS11_BURP2|nr:hypothetical protein BP1026B_II0420 [Burkholderia pseudomallei 1026b]EIF62413.1 hypothetical protein BP1026A_2106 [Burkholderia pseudomallei 1026a]RXS79834.1 hypothetical protein C2U63_16005 [Burkholderia pseudomallei]